MIVLVLTACPLGLRGFLTRWLMEISAGVFVGKVNARVRELLWERTVEMLGDGRAILVRSVHNEQGLDVRVHGHHWEPIDVDGLVLMLRPAEQNSFPDVIPRPSATKRELPRNGWSKAAKRRKYGR